MHQDDLEWETSKLFGPYFSPCSIYAMTTLITQCCLAECMGRDMQPRLKLCLITSPDWPGLMIFHVKHQECLGTRLQDGYNIIGMLALTCVGKWVEICNRISNCVQSNRLFLFSCEIVLKNGMAWVQGYILCIIKLILHLPIQKYSFYWQDWTAATYEPSDSLIVT